MLNADRKLLIVLGVILGVSMLVCACITVYGVDKVAESSCFTQGEMLKEKRIYLRFSGCFVVTPEGFHKAKKRDLL